MRAALKKEDLIYLMEQQEKLDRDMRVRFDIKDVTWNLGMKEEHRIALSVEVHEFINEAYKSWKYWKKKPMERENILEEGIDVIHFAMLLINKDRTPSNDKAVIMAYEIHNLDPLVKEESVKETLYNLSRLSATPEGVLYRTLQILEYYDFDRKQILDAYDRKNEINFKRIASEY